MVGLAGLAGWACARPGVSKEAVRNTSNAVRIPNLTFFFVPRTATGLPPGQALTLGIFEVIVSTNSVGNLKITMKFDCSEFYRI